MVKNFTKKSIYASLDKISFLKKSFTLKFMFIAFLGIHIPLLGLLFFLRFNSVESYSPLQIVLITLLLTLLATAITLFVLKQLLKPIIFSIEALNDFYRDRKLPNLPTNHQDEAGELMKLVNKTLNSLAVLSKEKEHIIALVSHNLRTPLTQIISLCELFKLENEGSTFYTDNISKITYNQLNDLSDLLNQLMQNKSDDFIEDESFNLSDFIKTEVEKQQLQLSSKNLTLKIENNEEIMVPLSKKSNIDLVFHNLLSNAIKFSYRNATIKVKIFSQLEQSLVTVTDQGIGFDADYENMLFMNIKDKGRLGTENESSTGLGLHLCKKTIQKIGGDLLAQSDGKDKGATFTLMI